MQTAGTQSSTGDGDVILTPYENNKMIKLLLEREFDLVESLPECEGG